MAEKKKEVIDSIKKVLSNGPKSINEISEKAEINWRTAEDYLNILKEIGLVYEKEGKNTRTFYLRERDNYFDLPVKYKDKKLISTVYHYIRERCLKIHKREPTRTHAYKILWNLNQKMKFNLPIGWYMFGPCCVQIYSGEEQPQTDLNSKTTQLLKTTVNEYCSCENLELQRKIYDEAKERLYQTKEDLLRMDSPKKEEINPMLMDLIKFAPKEAIETTTDFARATLLLGWSETRVYFENLWKYIAMLVFQHSLEPCYGYPLDVYFNRQIGNAKKETQLLITDLVRSILADKNI